MLRNLGFRLIFPIALALSTGLAAVVVFYTLAQQRNILLQNERSVFKVTESVIQGLHTIMLAGYADIAELYVEKLRRIEGVVEFRILRTDGLEAFKDNKTIRRVGEIRGDDRFAPRETERTIRALPADSPALAELLASRRYVSLYGGEAGHRTLTFLWPILNEKACRKCHGGDHEIRGVLQLTTSLQAVDEELAMTWRSAAAITVLALLAIVVAMVVMVRRSVVRPIATVAGAMARISSGEALQTVPVIGHDELAEMATSFNSMIEELRQTWSGFQNQHNQLQTVIHGSRDGIVVTDGSGSIVLVNRAAETLLGKRAPEIVAAGFDALFGDPARMQALLAEPRADSALVACNDRLLALSAAAIRTDDGSRLIGNAALLRDVTEIKRLEQMLRSLSNTDGLTGLANRRLLDQTLAREVTRCLSHGHALSILMFDVDHFKSFNDNYGHDQGDRVLRQVAEVAHHSIRTIDLACRYGGEEFVVILIETQQEGARIVAERMRAAIEAMRVDGLQVTVTIGVADLQQCGARNAEALIARADAALYAGKRGGRNRVVVATRE